MVQPSSVDVRLDRYFRLFDNHKYPFIDPAEDQPDLTHLIDEVLIGDDVTRAPDLEVTLLLDVDDDVKGIVRAKHLRQDIAEGILHDRDQRIAVDTLELLILEERFDQASSLFLLCHGAII